MKQNLSKNLIIIFTLTIAMIMAVSGCQNKKADTTPSATTTADTNQTTTPAQTGADDTQDIEAATTTEKIDANGWKTYRNEKLGLSFKYPGYWILNDCSPMSPGVLLDFIISKKKYDCNWGYIEDNTIIYISSINNKIMESNLQIEGKAGSLSFEKNYKLFDNGNKYLITESIDYVQGGEGEILSPISKRKYFTTYIPFNKDNSITIFYTRIFESEDPNFKYLPDYYDNYEKIISGIKVTNK